MKKRKLVLENGLVFEGNGFGSDKEAIAELVFNTSVVGYQEILSDPANYGRMICMTYPVIGSYGLTDEDYESKSITVSGLIVREYNDIPSNFRYTHKLGEVMDEYDVPGIEGVDTREIAKIIRDSGTMKALICDIDKPMAECMSIIGNYLDETNLSSVVSTKKVMHSRTTNPLFTVVAVDCGIRRSLVKMFNASGCNVVVVPYNTSIENILKHKPDGVIITDGPGSPSCATEAINLVKQLKGTLPILGVGNGHEIIALAYGAHVYKEKSGHNGCNLPVKNVNTGKIQITTQNSLYGVDKDSLDGKLAVTHINVLDNTVAGVINEKDMVMAIQYKPALNDDKENVFNRYVALIKKYRGEKNAKKNRY